MSETRRCDYEVPEAYRTKRYCQNRAAWLVEYTTPDDGRTMRKRTCAHRCFWHREPRFLPKGATQITTLALAIRPAARAATTEGGAT